MYIYEVFNKCDTEKVVRLFLDLYNQPVKKRTEQKLREAISYIHKINPKKTDSQVIIIEKDEEVGDYVYLLDKNTNEKFGIEINPWEDTLGYLADEQSLSQLGTDEFAALVLWEMTWFGFDEETIQNHVKSWDE